jgi:hypothetical protein
MGGYFMFMSVVWECMFLIVVLEVGRVGVGVAGWLAGWLGIRFGERRL